MAPIGLAIFDLDGTLIDSRRDLADSANVMLAGYSASPMAEADIARMVGCGAATLVKRVLKAANVDAPITDALDVLRRHLPDALAGTRRARWAFRSGRHTRYLAPRTAARMTSRGGLTPSHSANASAPCATSIPSPPSCARPRAAAAARNGVSPDE